MTKMDFAYLSTPEILENLEELITGLKEHGWWSEDQRLAERLLKELNARLDAGEHAVIDGRRIKRVVPRKLRIKDIQAGDVYKEDGKIIWTALEDMKETSSTSWTIKIQWADNGLGWRVWDYADADFELPGLERP